MFVAGVGHRLTIRTWCGCLTVGEVIRSEGEQVVAAYFSLVNLPTPLFGPLLQWQGSKDQAKKRLLAQTQRHSSIPAQAKSEPTWPPLPGDQWAAMLFKHKVTTGGGAPVTTATVLKKTPLHLLKILFYLSSDDIHHHEVFLSMMS